MFDRFSEKAIKVIMLAQEEARRLGHNYVGTEMLLLGIMGEGTNEAAKLLKAMDMTLKRLRTETEARIGKGEGFISVDIPFTAHAKEILLRASEYATPSALITPELLMAALLNKSHSNSSPGVEILRSSGLNLSAYIKALTNALAVQYAPPATPTAAEAWKALSSEERKEYLKDPDLLKEQFQDKVPDNVGGIMQATLDPNAVYHTAVVWTGLQLQRIKDAADFAGVSPHDVVLLGALAQAGLLLNLPAMGSVTPPPSESSGCDQEPEPANAPESANANARLLTNVADIAQGLLQLFGDADVAAKALVSELVDIVEEVEKAFDAA